MANKDVLLEIKGLHKTYQRGGHQLQILKGVDLRVAPGEIVALVGQSGSGKSTLLHLAGLLDRPTEGEIFIQGQRTQDLRDGQRTQLRRQSLGFVYQYHHLLGDFSALENIVLPQLLAHKKEAVARQRALEILTSFGLGQRADHRPAALSGGEQQRVAIGRALANGPQLLLADEPTGNLDTQTAAVVFQDLLQQVRQRQMGALIATHNPELARQMDKVYSLKEGRLYTGELSH